MIVSAALHKILAVLVRFYSAPGIYGVMVLRDHDMKRSRDNG
jgi:hypothetical protein